MKKVFKSALVLALGAVVLTACDQKADPEGLSKEETALKGVVEQYVPNVIYDIYGHLADETEALWGQLTALRDAASISQSEIDKQREKSRKETEKLNDLMKQYSIYDAR